MRRDHDDAKFDLISIEFGILLDDTNIHWV